MHGSLVTEVKRNNEPYTVYKISDSKFTEEGKFKNFCGLER